MNKKLMLFRIACVIFIVLNFIVSFRMESEADVLLMVFNFIFTLALIFAEVNWAFDNLK